MTKPFRVFSTFSGIGGFEVGIENAAKGRPVEVVGYSEIDKHAISVYEKHFKGVQNYGDITKIEASELPEFDCLVGGFPCQAFSIAGKRQGFNETRGTLFFDLARILRAKRPRLFVFENVKGLLNHDEGRTFKTIVATIDELGYDCQWQVINSKNTGVPQNRERVYIVGHIRGSSRPQVFPIVGTNGQVIKQVNAPKHSRNRVYDPDGLSPTLGTMQGGGRQPKIYVQEATKKGYAEAEVSDAINLTAINSKTRRGRVGKGIAHTLDTAMRQYTIDPAVKQPDQVSNTVRTSGRGSITPKHAWDLVQDNQAVVRRFTPRECERLQAFPDDWTEYGVEWYTDDHGLLQRRLKPISDSQRYKMCGNAVTTNAVQAVFERIFA